MNSDTIQLQTLLPHQQIILGKTERYQAVLIFSGEGEIFFQNKIEDFEKNCVFLFPPSDEIRIRCSSFQEMTLGLLLLDPSVVSEQSYDPQLQLLIEEYLLCSPESRRTVFTAPAFEHINRFFTLMYTEYSSARPYSQRVFQIICGGFLVHLAREYYCAHPPKTGHTERIARTLGVVESVKQAIQSRYDEPLSLELLAQEQHVSAPYLSTLFKKKTGMRLIEFLNTVRIKHTQELLLDSEELVIDIATAAGFNSTSHFDLTFRQYTGFSPLEYRAKFKK